MDPDPQAAPSYFKSYGNGKFSKTWEFKIKTRRLESLELSITAGNLLEASWCLRITSEYAFYR